MQSDFDAKKNQLFQAIKTDNAIFVEMLIRENKQLLTATNSEGLSAINLACADTTPHKNVLSALLALCDSINPLNAGISNEELVITYDTPEHHEMLQMIKRKREEILKKENPLNITPNEEELTTSLEKISLDTLLPLPIDKKRLYIDEDLNSYTGTMIRFSQNDGINGYRDKCLYLLDGDFPSGIEDDARRYLVAVTNAIDCSGKALPIDHFLDKSKQTRNTLSACLEKLLDKLEDLKKFEDDREELQKQVSLLLNQRGEPHEKSFAITICNKLLKAKFEKESLERLIAKRDGQDYKDVFDEIKPMIIGQEQANFKILFPYNLTQSHWLTGEIIVHKNGNEYDVEIYAHDPYGKNHRAKMDDVHFNQIKAAIEKQIKGMGGNLVKCENKESPYGRRQLNGDGVSCGVITASDIVKRIVGKSLNIDKPYEYGALSLREQHIAEMKKCLPETDATLKNFIARNVTTINLAKSISTKKVSDKINITTGYKETDIDDYLDIILETVEYGGHQPSSHYLLNGKDGDGKFLDQEDKQSYIVAVTEAIDTQQKLPIGYFFNKTKTPHPILEYLKLITQHPELLEVWRKLNSKALQERLEKFLSEKTGSQIDATILAKITSKLRELDNNFLNLRNYISKLEKKNDVLDEILTAMQKEGNEYAKILFPFNLDESQWVTGEIHIHKDKVNKLAIELYVHNPRDLGKPDQEISKQIEQALQEKIKQYAPLTIGNFKVCESNYERRQELNDVVSSGVIVVEDILKRAKGEKLTSQPDYAKKALAIRQKHIENVQKYLPASHPTCKSFIKRNKPIVQKATEKTDNAIMLLRKQKSLIYDLLRLVMLREKIEEFKKIYPSDNLEEDFDIIKTILAEIGRQAKINYNDKDSNCVRNKYGYEDRSSSGNIRATGISWENLALLTDICGVSNYPGIKKEQYLLLIKAALPDIAKELNNLYQNAIPIIITQEKEQLVGIKQSLENQNNKHLTEDLEQLEKKLESFPVISGILNGAISNIMIVTNCFRDERALYQMAHICSEKHQTIFDSDMSERYNRYKLGRILLILGENANTLTEEAKAQALQIPFKKLINIRNNLIHFVHSKYKRLNKEEAATVSLQELASNDIPLQLRPAIIKLLEDYRSQKKLSTQEIESFKEEEIWEHLKSAFLKNEETKETENIIVNDQRKSEKIAHDFSIKYIRPLVGEFLYGEGFDEEVFKSIGDAEEVRSRGQRIGRETARIKELLQREKVAPEHYAVNIMRDDQEEEMTLDFDSDGLEELKTFYLKRALEKKIESDREEFLKLREGEKGLKEELEPYKKLEKYLKSKGDKNVIIETLIKEIEEQIKDLKGNDKKITSQRAGLEDYINILKQYDQKLTITDILPKNHLQIEKIESEIKENQKQQAKYGALTAKPKNQQASVIATILPNLDSFINELKKRSQTGPIKKYSEFENAQRIIVNILEEIEFLKTIISSIKKQGSNALDNHFDVEYAIGIIGQQIRDLMDKKVAYALFCEVANKINKNELLDDLQNIINIRNQGLLHDLYSVDPSNMINKAEKEVIPIYNTLNVIAQAFKYHWQLESHIEKKADESIEIKPKKESKFAIIHQKYQSKDDTMIDYRKVTPQQTNETSFEKDSKKTDKEENIESISPPSMGRSRSFSR